MLSHFTVPCCHIVSKLWLLGMHKFRWIFQNNRIDLPSVAHTGYSRNRKVFSNLPASQSYCCRVLSSYRASFIVPLVHGMRGRDEVCPEWRRAEGTQLCSMVVVSCSTSHLFSSRRIRDCGIQDVSLLSRMLLAGAWLMVCKIFNIKILHAICLRWTVYINDSLKFIP